MNQDRVNTIEWTNTTWVLAPTTPITTQPKVERLLTNDHLAKMELFWLVGHLSTFELLEKKGRVVLVSYTPAVGIDPVLPIPLGIKWQSRSKKWWYRTLFGFLDYRMQVAFRKPTGQYVKWLTVQLSKLVDPYLYEYELDFYRYHMEAALLDPTRSTLIKERRLAKRGLA